MRRSWIGLLLAGVMIVSLCGCGIRVKKTEDDKKEKTVETSTLAPEATTEDMDQTQGLILPENFDNMENTMLALAVQHYVNGYSYYGTDTQGKDSDAFFASMAVLTSLMEKSGEGSGAEEKDGYYYITEDSFNMYATALFADYGTNLETPEIPEDNDFVTRDDDTDTIGFIKGETQMDIHILSCVEEGDSYRISVELLSDQSSVASYEFLVGPSAFEGENNLFAYSVKEMIPLEIEGEEYNFDKNTEDQPEETASTAEEETQDPSSDVDSDDEETASDYESNGETISKEEAKKKAEEDYGKGEYTYDGTEKIGEKDYYKYKTTDSEGNSKDVLISTDGQDSVSGTKNEDGSWSLDQ